MQRVSDVVKRKHFGPPEINHMVLFDQLQRTNPVDGRVSFSPEHEEECIIMFVTWD